MDEVITIDLSGITRRVRAQASLDAARESLARAERQGLSTALRAGNLIRAKKRYALVRRRDRGTLCMAPSKPLRPRSRQRRAQRQGKRAAGRSSSGDDPDLGPAPEDFAAPPTAEEQERAGTVDREQAVSGAARSRGGSRG